MTRYAICLQLILLLSANGAPLWAKDTVQETERLAPASAIEAIDSADSVANDQWATSPVRTSQDEGMLAAGEKNGEETERQLDEARASALEEPANEGYKLAQAVPEQQQLVDSIEEVTRSIARAEIDLLKLNTRYRIESTKQSKFKVWRQFIYNLGQYSVSNAGIDHVAYARWHTWQHPARATKDFLRSGPIMLLIGHSIGVGGILIEGTLDLFGDYQRRRKGFDGASFRRSVLDKQREVDALIARREALIAGANLSHEAKALLSCEGELLKDVRDCALNEYAKFRVRAAKWRTARDVNSLVSFGAATTGGYLGALMAIIAIANRKPKM
ncbi:MAG TPA: hypothetical protein V6D17_02210, partial [Candidatus Obscuribacterales bacterium]